MTTDRVAPTDRLAMAAQLRRQAAESERHNHGDRAYALFRSADPAGGNAHRGGRTPREIRAAKEVRGGKELFHTSGYFTRYNRPYPMWDTFGEYRESVRPGAGARTLAAKPEVAFLVNHGGMAMARTTSIDARSSTLELREDSVGGWHDAWLNPARSDVNNLIIAIDDGDVPQMSFAFMIPEGQGEWSADFSEFEIIEYDINGGDVSACNFGANPYTDITARTPDVLDDLNRLPQGALWEARRRLEARTGSPREQITVHRTRRGVDPKARPVLQKMQGRLARTADRMVALAERAGLKVSDLPTAQLPWYEIRAAGQVTASPDDEGVTQAVETDVFIFDEIGGSFGVDAETFARELNDITTPVINLRINSPGGSVKDGIAIHSSLLHHPSRIISYVDGIAASAASVIALGGDEIVTMPGAQWMMHDASTMAEGNAAELHEVADWVGKQSENLASLYAARLGVTTEEARQLMLDETWAFAEESVTMGLADRVGARNDAKPPPAELAERMAHKHDLTRFAYRYASREAAPAPMLRRDGAARSPFAAGGRIPDGSRALDPTDLPDTTEGGLISGSTPHESLGRSIALIEAQLDLDEHTST